MQVTDLLYQLKSQPLLMSILERQSTLQHACQLLQEVMHCCQTQGRSALAKTTCQSGHHCNCTGFAYLRGRCTDLVPH